MASNMTQSAQAVDGGDGGGGFLQTVLAPNFGVYMFFLFGTVLNKASRDAVLLFAAFITLRFGWTVLSYRRGRQQRSDAVKTKDLPPPTYPSWIPIIGNVFPLVLNTEFFLRVATSYKGSLTSTRIPIFGTGVYVFQDRDTVRELMRQRDRLTPIDIRFVLPSKSLFGMPESKGLDAYRADDSGPLEKPREASTVSPDDRIDSLHHQAFHRAFMGPGLAPTRVRFRAALRTRLDALCGGSEWVQVDDLFSLIGKTVSAAMTEAVFGPSLMKVNPDFIENIWAYDTALPWLVRGVPRWMNPQPHRIRDKIHSQIKDWYAYSRKNFREDSIGPDGDSDPYWGSEMVRFFQRTLSDTGKHSDDSMAAHDLGLIWGATSNAASVAALALFHIFSNSELHNRVSSELETYIPERSSPDVFDSLPTHSLSEPALLASIYTETVRLYASGFLMVASPPDRDVALKKWLFPRRSFGLIAPALTHRDESFWNTKDGAHPLDTFWPDRFVIYPGDETSGPIRPDVRANKRSSTKKSTEGGDDRPRYSTEGLDGTFIPFGGGSGQCPGRFLAKDAVLATCAWLVGAYDIEILTDSLSMDKWRFGLSVGRPSIPIVARIRKR